MVEEPVMVPKQSYTTQTAVESMDADRLFPGCPMKVYNVAEIELQGQPGVLVKYKPEKAAWVVQLNNGMKVLVKPENIVVEQPAPASHSLQPQVPSIGGYPSPQPVSLPP